MAMGLLDILNGMQNGPRGQTEPGKGGMSPMTMAMLALLAYKAYGKMTSGGQAQAAPAAPAGRVPPPQAGSGADGGLGGLLGSLLGGAPANSQGGIPGGAGAQAGTSGLGGALGGLLGGAAAGGLLTNGLNGLLEQLQQSGQGDAARSWVGTGPNQEISPHALGDALGDDTVNSLAEQAGLSRIQLLDGLSQQLPQFVDQMTPQGRVPTEREAQRMV
jgi:uncharacterized protein YidB (DUF937 family)